MNRKIIASEISVLIFFLLSLVLIAGYSGNAHATCGSAAYIYATDLTSAQGFKSFIESDPNGCEVVDLIPLETGWGWGNISPTFFSGYDLIIIGSDTGSINSFGNAASISPIYGSGKPILGLGEGGYAFFGKLSLELGWPNGAHWSENDFDYRLYIVNPSHTIFISPYTITIPTDFILAIYETTAGVAIYEPSAPPSGVTLYASLNGSPYHYPLIQQDRYFLWGFTAPPSFMIDDGRNLFINVVNYLTSLTPSASSAPLPPTLVSPIDENTAVNTSPTFSWNESIGAASYQLEVATDSGFESLFDSESTESTSYTVSDTVSEPLSNDTIYYWRVNATNANGTSDWSDTWEFRTQPAFGNVFIGVRGMLDPDNDEDGLDDILLEGSGPLQTDPTKKTLFVRPKDEASGGYWSGFMELFKDPLRPGFAKIPAFDKLNIEISVIGAPDNPYPPMRDFAYNPAADSLTPNCDILEIVYKWPTAYYTTSTKKGHIWLTSGTKVTWSWDTKGYTKYDTTSQQYKSFGYFTPEIYPFPLKNYFIEAPYPTSGVTYKGIAIGNSPMGGLTVCDSRCAPGSGNASPLNLNINDTASAPYLMPPDYTLDQGNLTDGTVEFNAITFASTTGNITGIGNKGKMYSPNTVLTRTIIHEMGHALLKASNSDHCTDPTCIMYSGVKDWNVQDFGITCTHKAGGSLDIRNRVHNTRQIPQVPTPLSPTGTAPAIKPTFNWSPVMGAATYGLQISTSSSFTTTVLSKTGLTSPIISPPYKVAVTLTSGATYWWRVNATNRVGTSSWSSPLSFKAQ